MQQRNGTIVFSTGTLLVREIFNLIKIDLAEYADKSDEEVDVLWAAFKVKLGVDRYKLEKLEKLDAHQPPPKKRRKGGNNDAAALRKENDEVRKRRYGMVCFYGLTNQENDTALKEETTEGLAAKKKHKEIESLQMDTTEVG